jgi:hypothetical protein
MTGQRPKLRAGISFAPSLERAGVSIWRPDCQSDQIRTTTNARDYELLKPGEASHGSNTPHTDMD